MLMKFQRTFLPRRRPDMETPVYLDIVEVYPDLVVEEARGWGAFGTLALLPGPNF